MCVRRAPVVGISRRSRSAVTNRSRVLLEGDERSSRARRLRDLIADFSKDLGELNAIDEALVKTAAALALQSELRMTDIANGVAVPSDELIRLASTSRRALAAVSAKAAAKPSGTMTLAEYMASKAAAEPDEDDDGEGQD